jgi:hypothetical protein
LKRFGKEINDHLFPGTISNGGFFLLNAVSGEVEATVEVLGSLAA